MSLCCIFNYGYAMRCRNRLNGVHVGGMTVQMNYDDSLRFRGNCSPYRGRIHAPCVLFAINEHWTSAGMCHCVCRGDKSKRRHNNLVTQSNPYTYQSQVQSTGPVTCCNAETRPTVS